MVMACNSVRMNQKIHSLPESSELPYCFKSRYRIGSLLRLRQDESNGTFDERPNQNSLYEVMKEKRGWSLVTY